MEKTKGAWEGFEKRARIWELAGVVGPIPHPSSNAAGIISQNLPKLAISIASAAAIRQIWLALNGPNLMITLPAALEEKKPMQYTSRE
jgi:hypothetical protein